MEVYSTSKILIKELRCYRELKDTKRLNASGSLGGGNHFIELDKDEYGMNYLVVHTGSRNRKASGADLSETGREMPVGMGRTDGDKTE